METEESAFHTVELDGTIVMSRPFRQERDLDEEPAQEVAGETYVDYFLTAGELVPIRIHYAQMLGTTLIRLHWAADHLNKELIDPHHLYHTLGSETTPK